MATPPRQFRLPDDTLAAIDKLATHLDLPSRAAVIRVAVSRMARDELPEFHELRTRGSARKKTLPKSK